MVLEAVAKYLSYLERGKSVAESVSQLCYSYNAPLISEFHNLYRSLFHEHDEHVKIVKALAKSKRGLSYQEIVEKTELSAGGTLSSRLEELKQSGFISKIPIFGKGKKDYLYLLTDEYSLFYLAWSSGVSSIDLQNRGCDYWILQRNTPTWNSWTGHAFKCLCLKHIESLKGELGIAAVQTKASKWRHKPSLKEKERGAEIDLLIDRTDNCINLCEIKFCKEEFTIDKDYAEKIQNKKECFLRIEKPHKSLFTTLITTYGSKHNKHYLSSIDREVTMDALFLR